MAEVTHEQVETNGVELHVATAGPADGPPVVLCHGFPELWYSWRHQLGGSGGAGYSASGPAACLVPHIFGDKFFCMLYFQEVGPPEAEFDADPRRFVRTMLYSA